MRKAGIYLNNGNIEDALVNYEKIEEDWSYDILADDALYKRAKIYDDILNNSELAMRLYEQILLEHTSSIYVAESRKRFRDLSKFYFYGKNFFKKLPTPNSFIKKNKDINQLRNYLLEYTKANLTSEKLAEYLIKTSSIFFK